MLYVLGTTISISALIGWMIESQSATIIPIQDLDLEQSGPDSHVRMFCNHTVIMNR